MKNIAPLTYLSFCVLSACAPLKQSPQDKYFSNNDALRRDYQNAVIDAVIPDKNKVHSGLMQINGPENSTGQEWVTVDGRKMVLVTTLIKDEFLKYWMNDEPFELKINSSVSIPSEWSRFKQDFVPLNDTHDMIRMMQLLGLPQDEHHTVMIEYYANAEKIFRPCKNSQTTTDVCPLDYPTGTKKEYIEWFETYKDKSYKGTPAYPFTQMGYCYDWNRNSKDHVGLSEFIVPKGTLIKVKNRMSYQEFIDEIK